MRFWKFIVCATLGLALGSALVAQAPVPSLQDLVGARGAAIDTMSQRSYTFLRTEKLGGSATSYWQENENGSCVIARVANGAVASIVYAPYSDCQSGGGATGSGTAGGETTGVDSQFETVCGVNQGGRWYRYRCEVINRTTEGDKKLTILRFPDMEFKLHWHGEDSVSVVPEGGNPIQTTYSNYEGETNFQLDGKTYFYISDQQAAQMELRDFDG